MRGFQILRNRTREKEKLQIPGWRFGRIVSVCAVAPPKGHWHKNTPTAVIFKCDCGKVFKIPVKSIRQAGIPETCPKCPLGPLHVEQRKRKKKRTKNRPQFKVFGLEYAELIKEYYNEYKFFEMYKHKFCKRWRKSFEWFLHDTGRRPPGASLCRKNRNRLFGPDNCYWGLNKEDRSNLRWCGTKCTKTWAAKRFGIPLHYIAGRMMKGDTKLEEIIVRYDAYQKRLKEEKKQRQRDEEQ